MGLTLKLTHFQDSVHVQVPNLHPNTIYNRFMEEFPDYVDPSPTLRWRDIDGDWIYIRKDDMDLEVILTQVVEKYGSVHIQSGDSTGGYEPTDLGTLMKRYERVMDTFDLLTRSIVKLPPISNILIVTKPDPKLARLTKELSIWLLENFAGVTIFVDKKLQEKSSFKYRQVIEYNPTWKDRIHFWASDRCENKAPQIHLAVALGGDGTVLYTAWMFQQRVPPIVAFHLGSLGFLTNFHFDNYKATITNIIRGNGMNLNLRMRLQCSVYRYKDIAQHHASVASVPTRQPLNGEISVNGAHTEGSSVANDMDEHSSDEEDKMIDLAESHRKAEIMHKVKAMDSKRAVEVADLGICHENARALITRVPKPKIEEFAVPSDTWQVLNEVTVDRGSNAGMLLLELFVDGEPVTTILADGLVIATATGSTAYSVLDLFYYSIEMLCLKQVERQRGRHLTEDTGKNWAVAIQS
ncbi:hypothetical protein BGX27_006586 [Mortierella sp. AM989]|nr:hypothetical protein BGX27_006586 [Mortierella sp. AM989]